MELEIPIKEGAEAKTMLKIINCFINNLTDIELDIVSGMLNKGYTTLTKSNRADLRSSLNMDKYLFNNYIKYLKDKKVLFVNNEVLTLNPMIRYYTSGNEITIKLKPNV